MASCPVRLLAISVRPATAEYATAVRGVVVVGLIRRIGIRPDRGVRSRSYGRDHRRIGVVGAPSVAVPHDPVVLRRVIQPLTVLLAIAPVFGSHALVHIRA